MGCNLSAFNIIVLPGVHTVRIRMQAHSLQRCRSRPKKDWATTSYSFHILKQFCHSRRNENKITTNWLGYHSHFVKGYSCWPYIVLRSGKMNQHLLEDVYMQYQSCGHYSFYVKMCWKAITALHGFPLIPVSSFRQRSPGKAEWYDILWCNISLHLKEFHDLKSGSTLYWSI